MAWARSSIYSGSASRNMPLNCRECSTLGTVIGWNTAFSGRKIRLSSSTAMMGPMEQRAISPKLSWEECLVPRNAETPTPKAMIKGTVIGPVVTPPESKATARKSGGAKKAIPKAIR